MNAYRALAAFPDVSLVLQALRERGVPTGILSNGDPDMLDVAVRSAKLKPLARPRAQRPPRAPLQTDPAVYALGPQALKLPASDILFVSSNGWDALGATWFGYTTLWVNRNGSLLKASARAHAHRHQPARRARLLPGRMRAPVERHRSKFLISTEP